MRNNISKYILFILTLKDIGLRRVCLRINYEIKLLLANILPKRINFFLLNPTNNYPIWNRNYDDFFKTEIKATPLKRIDSINFKFINISRELKIPFSWHDKNWTRLWQFNLHYFDWAKNLIDKAIIDKEWSGESIILEELIDNWILNNEIGKGDGWNSYTISLRSRNWAWLFRFKPELANDSRLKSLWDQILWLESHLEKCHGGNHYLENLISLVLISMQYYGKSASKIYSFSIKELKNELNRQILSDGGHEERSASYHVLILDRLIELAYAMLIFEVEVPYWLDVAIQSMSDWLKKIKLLQNKFPRFNDSAPSICPRYEIVEDFANSYLNNIAVNRNGFRKLISKISINKIISNIKSIQSNKFNKLIDLKETGWTIFRTTNKWELIFKCGESCPKHLPAHVHSDLLSFDLLHNGIPIIAETGTSTYENNIAREFERSSNAHNVMQLALAKRSKIKNDIKWIEPVETWSSFRAARKAKIIHKKLFYSEKGDLILEGAHNAFSRIGAHHIRRIKLSEMESKDIRLEITDSIKCKKNVYWRQWWHLGPNIPKSYLLPLIKEFEKNLDVNYIWYETYYAEDFNCKLKRNTLCLCGYLPKGEHKINSKLILKQI